MSKLINLARKIGMPDEEQRLKLLLFQLLSQSKSYYASTSYHDEIMSKV